MCLLLFLYARLSKFEQMNNEHLSFVENKNTWMAKFVSSHCQMTEVVTSLRINVSILMQSNILIRYGLDLNINWVRSSVCVAIRNSKP